MSRLYINKETGSLVRSDLHLVDLTLSDGTVIKGLEPRQLFPVNRKYTYISLLDADEKEVAMVRSPEELDQDSARGLMLCFDEYYRIPVITKLISSDERFWILTWQVETDKGPVTFRIGNRHTDIKFFSKSPRILIKDTDDNRYEIPDYRKLDAKSRRILFTYM